MSETRTAGPERLVAEPERDPGDVVRRALERLVALQERDGSFRDFELGTGSSGPWVTAHVALRLAGLPARFADERVTDAIGRARDYLLARPVTRWAYNERVPADADTIAHVLALLDAVDELSIEGARLLASHQTSDGGFATFVPGSAGADFPAWLRSHPDVTPVALRALAPYRTLPGLAQVIERGLARREGDRVDPAGAAGAAGWPAFWWDLDWYTAAMWCAACRTLGTALELGPPPEPAPAPRSLLDAAHLLEVALAAGWTALAARLAAALAAAAAPDGSWPTSRALRVTAPACERPWSVPEAEGGRLYADVRGVYSAAAITGALARYTAGAAPAAPVTAR